MPTPEPTDVRAELAAMRRIVAALNPLDDRARDRVISWAWDRYRLPLEDAQETTDA